MGVVMQAMDYKLKYGFEIVDSLYDFVYTPMSEKIVFNFLSALSTNSFVLAQGPQASGKTFTIKAFAKLMGKELFTFDLARIQTCQEMMDRLQGSATGGLWVFFDNLHQIDLRILSVLA